MSDDTLTGTSRRAGPAGSSGQAARLDPDRLAELEDERDHLLSSLDDLEREHDAGDLDDVDFAALSDDYTVRAAEVIRAIDEYHDVLARSRPPRRPLRTALVVVAVLAVAGLAGVLVARASGQRGAGTITGNDNSLRQQLANCQMLSFQKPDEGIRCYAGVLESYPENLEALTYQGWAYIRDDQVEKGAANLARAVELDPDYPDARVFRAVLLSRAGAAAAENGDTATARESFLAAASEIDRFHRNDPPEVAVQVLRQEGLERTIFFGLLDAPTVACWQQAAGASDKDSAIDQAFLDRLGSCLDAALVADPTSTDAMLSKALSLLGPDRTDLAGARAMTDRILAIDPSNANALLLQASIALAERDPDGAAATLDRLDPLPWPTAAFLIGPPDQMRRAIESARRAGSSTTAAPSPTTTTEPRATASTVPGAPSIPNAGGG